VADESNRNESDEAPEVEAPETDAAETEAGETEAAAERGAAGDEGRRPEADAPQAEEVVVEGDEVLTDEDVEEEYVEERPREKPAIPGMDLEVDIVREGEEALRREREREAYGYVEDYDDEEPTEAVEAEEELAQPIAHAAIDLAAGARYRATGKRKTAVARVTLKPGTGAYAINGRPLDSYFPRNTLQRTIRQPLETVGYDDRMDVVATMHGGGVSAQADALRHGISRALIEADPNLRSELKRRGFLTRDARVKERKKAGLKKARKRPQFSKR
jgi:small subunit ribosomal protein S9